MAHNNSQNNIANSLLNYLLVVILLSAIIGATIYQKKQNQQTQQDSTTPQQVNISSTPSMQVPSPTATKIANSQVTTGHIFIDKNKNNKQDNGETNCDVCIAKALIAGQVNAEVFPNLNNLLQISVQGGGILQSDKLLQINTVWGVFADREIIIPNYLVLNGDATSEIDIPAWEIDTEISGVNANISNIVKTAEQVGQNFTIRYYFSNLLPVLSAAKDKDSFVWVYFLPDSSQLAKVYLNKGKLMDNPNPTDYQDKYYLEIVWPLSEYYVSSSKKNSVNFVLL